MCRMAKRAPSKVHALSRERGKEGHREGLKGCFPFSTREHMISSSSAGRSLCSSTAAEAEAEAVAVAVVGAGAGV